VADIIKLAVKNDHPSGRACITCKYLTLGRCGFYMRY
jgi:hypothetical protein